ncbi:MAG: phytanoyl-CoA dioxygenase family protein [Pseudomonadota bacterium]
MLSISNPFIQLYYELDIYLNWPAMNTEKLQSDYRRNGVAFLPDAFDPNTLNMAEAAWDWSMSHPGPYASLLLENSVIPVKSAEAAREIITNEPGFFYQDISAPNTLEAYRDLITSGPVTNLLKCLFATPDDKEPDVWFLGEQVFLKEGGEQLRTGWHQDISDIRAEGLDLAVLWITFDAVDKVGALEMVQGSHLGPVYSSIYQNYRAEPIPDIEPHREDFDIVSFACTPGDLVIFHPGVLHGGGATSTGQRRRTLALRFFGPDCRVASDSKRASAGQPFRHPRFFKVI